jgi:hypothetical protein
MVLLVNPASKFLVNQVPISENMLLIEYTNSFHLEKINNNIW